MFEQIVWPESSEAVRLFHGRGHAFPGYEHITVDWYAPVVLITSFAEPEESWLAQLTELILTTITGRGFSDISVVIQYRCRQGAPFEVLYGNAPEQLVISERGLKFQLRLFQNQNTGLFLDIANGRDWVRANSKGRRILNLFAYTCGFSVAAIAGGAESVVNVDMARGALNTGRENHRLNQQDLTKVRFEGVDIFRSFGRLKRHGPYDLLICDPPTFQKGSVDISRDYAKIIRRLPEFMADGSDLIMCLNAQQLDEAFLKGEMARECPGAEFQEMIPAPEVFKEAIAGRGLKVLRYVYRADQKGLKSSTTA